MSAGLRPMTVSTRFNGWTSPAATNPARATASNSSYSLKASELISAHHRRHRPRRVMATKV